MNARRVSWLALLGPPAFSRGLCLLVRLTVERVTETRL